MNDGMANKNTQSVNACVFPLTEVLTRCYLHVRRANGTFYYSEDQIGYDIVVGVGNSDPTVLLIIGTQLDSRSKKKWENHSNRPQCFKDLRLRLGDLAAAKLRENTPTAAVKVAATV